MIKPAALFNKVFEKYISANKADHSNKFTKIICIMTKNILLFFCFCLAAGLLMIHHLPRQVANLAVSSKNTVLQPVSRPIITTSSISPVTKAAVEQIEHSKTLIAPEPAIAKASLQTNTVADGVDAAEQKKFQLLCELRAWAAKDTEGALTAAMKLPAGDERNQALAAVCFGVAETDPADGVKMAKSLNLDGQPGAIIENLAQQWAMTDLPSALDWANSQPAGSERDGLTTRIAYIMSQSDPTDAAKLVINQIPSGPAQDEAVMTVLNQWANQNLVVATTWAKGLPAGPLQARAINELEGIESHQQALAHQ